MSNSDDTSFVDSTHKATNSVEVYSVYSAGGLSTQYELAMNVLIKEAVWQLSNGKFQFVLPQSKEMRGLELEAANIRNVDLLELVQADVVVARFDGLELDAGTVVEFTLAKSLGKPTVILRCDSRHLSGQDLDEPYNLMVKGWPRTVEVYIDSLINYISSFNKEHQALGDRVTFQATMKAELNTVQKGIDEISKKIIDGLEAVVKMGSPYPSEYQEIVYKALRYSPGGGFDKLLTEEELGRIIQRLRKNGTL